MNELDLKKEGIRGINSKLQLLPKNTNEKHWVVTNPMGQHSIAVGLDGPLQIDIKGHVGFYCGGMNKESEITIHGHAGVGTAENMMSGIVWVKGNSSESAGATGNGGLLVIDGDASSRRGNLVVCGDAGDALGDSIYEARLYVKGKVASLGADCIEKEMRAEHIADLERLLKAAKRKEKPSEFKRYGSARKLYNFSVDHADAY